MKYTENILILDGDQRSSLAVTRSLGKKGIHIIVGDENITTLAGKSKYCSDKMVYPSPYKSPGSFINCIINYLNNNKIAVLMPMTDCTAELILGNRSKFCNVVIPFPDYVAYEEVTNKYSLFKTAEKIGISIPSTIYIEQSDSIRKISKKLKYPVVLKPHRSNIMIDEVYHKTRVRYAHTFDELNEIILNDLSFKTRPFLIQEYIRGEGQGLFVLYENGKLITSFSHRRIREKPPSGGISVLSESISVNPKMLKIATDLFDPIHWHGIAMAEFKMTSDGTPYLIEINGRFWGSLQLSIESGIDFPYLLYMVALGHKIDPDIAYIKGIKCRWLMGDIDHLYLKLFSKLQFTKREKILSLFSFFNVFDFDVKYEINKLDDIKPFIYEIKQYVNSILNKLRTYHG